MYVQLYGVALNTLEAGGYLLVVACSQPLRVREPATASFEDEKTRDRCVIIIIESFELCTQPTRSMNDYWYRGILSRFTDVIRLHAACCFRHADEMYESNAGPARRDRAVSALNMRQEDNVSFQR